MSHSVKPSFAKRTLTVLASVGGAIGSIFYVQAFAKIDPLQNMRNRAQNEGKEQGITLANVHLVQYHGERRVAEATVAKAFITQDRSQYRIEGVENGAYFSEDGKKVNFSAPHAVWQTASRTFEADNGARVWNKDMDLNTKLLQMKEVEQTIYAPGAVEGRFLKGHLKVNNFLYDVKRRGGSFGPGEWKGEMALSLEPGKQDPLKKWQFTQDGGDYSLDNGVKTVTNATATDGEVIIKADKIEHVEKTDVVTATGHVRYYSASSNLVCDTAVIYRKEKRAVLTGHVDMLVKPKDKQTGKPEVVEIPPFRPVVPKAVAEDRPAAPAQSDPKSKQLDDDLQNAKTLRSYPTAITADRIEYWYGKGNRHANVTGNPFAEQNLPEGRWRRIWAHSAQYDGEKEMLYMKSQADKSDVHVQTSIGDDLTATEAEVSTKEDVEKMYAKNVKATVYGKSDEDEGGPGIKPPDPLKPGTKKGGDLKGKIGGR